MTFALDDGASPEELLAAVNYLLANLSPSNYSNQQTGEIVDASGTIIGYLYKYIHVKYADSFDGSTNFSNSPTNRLYYGIRNSDSATESTNPLDYVWNQVTGGFGTTRFLWYITTGGRQIQFQIASTQPNTGWTQDSGAAIDLDTITAAASSPANFIINRITNDSSAPTNAECIGAIGRTPISGDLCTVVYNSGISSILYKYTTGWAAYIKYISSDLILAGTIKGTNIDAATITGSNISANTITGSNIAGNTITASKMVTGTITAASAIIADAAITTAKIANAQVETLKIADNAVTIPAGANSSGTSASISMDTTGFPGIKVLIVVTWTINLNAWSSRSGSILRNGTVIKSYSTGGSSADSSAIVTCTYMDSPPEGVNVYSSSFNPGSSNSVAQTTIAVIGAKR